MSSWVAPTAAVSHNLYRILQGGFPDPAQPCLVNDNGATTYGQLDALSARLAWVLDGLGVTAGERVLVQVDKSVPAVALYLACLRAGAVYVPLNTAYTAVELMYFVEDSEPRVIVCRPDQRAAIVDRLRNAGRPAVLTLDDRGRGTLVERSEGVQPRQDIAVTAPDDIAAILYTSGTTGRSKGAMLTHRNLSSNASVLHQLWGWRPGDVLIHALPIFHVHGLFVALHTAWLNGSRVYFFPRFDADQILARLPAATVMMGVPTFYSRLLKHPGLTREACRHMRLFISGSAPLLKQTFAAFEARTGHRILERYGMTEAGMITSNPLDGERLPETVGYPLPEIEVRVVGEDGGPVGADGVGVLEINGPNVFKGYWRAPEKTRAEFRPDGFFITGDLARIAADGRISIVGRAKDLIISGGFNIYPKEIENCLDKLDCIVESAVVGVPHPDFGEGVVAVVVPRSGDAPDEQQIRVALSDSLAKFKIPKRVLFVDELPRNAMGKVQKRRLREHYAKLFNGN